MENLRNNPAGESPEQHWESQYADSERRWSGKVNSTTADVVATLAVGDALELGCGEGGDAIWMAEQGWRVTAVDISTTAVRRGAQAAASRGVSDRIGWVAHDLSTWSTEAMFDLVTATFFHSRTEFPRTEILRRAAGRLRGGGHLLIVSHLFQSDDDLPPWVHRHMEETGEHGPPPVDLTSEDEIAELALDPADWEVVLAEVRRREATGPDGVEHAAMKDAVTLLRRR